ncbi:hypothetical protein M422DRAFT_52784 [Sphaerobolus stellatus SS14]|uniref:DUF7025 domain-containing protein n=1 Tax=Sphaerobolus stellatus (strain SS14) TaxID=990650 RepID=A0A0C9TR33_SPHS4|nr:hypothetical protein M422DRAFT_52784 [Sphaerobolus stellatus SS14]
MPSSRTSSKIFDEPTPTARLSATDIQDDGQTKNAKTSAIGSVGALCELLKLDHRYDRTGNFVIIPKATWIKDEKRETFTEHALVFIRRYNQKHEPEIVKYYPAHPERFHEISTIESPFMILYHHWENLKNYRNNIEDDMIRIHLNFLLDFMDNLLREDSRNTKRLIDSGNISFNLLWTIFHPGDLILDRVVQKHEHLWRLILTLELSGTDYDGMHTGRVSHTHLLRDSAVGRSSMITRLDMYPLHFANNQE